MIEDKRLGIFEYIAFALLLLAILPLFVSLLSAAINMPQLKDALFIIAFSTLIVCVEYKVKLSKYAHLSKRALLFLLIAYASFFLGKLNVFFYLGAVVLALSGIMLLFLDKKDYRIAYAFGASFFIYCLLLFFSGFTDFPLRVLAAKASQFALNLFGANCNVFMISKPVPEIILHTQKYGDFLVATQCNGWGIISSALVLSAFLATLSQCKIIKKVIFVLLAVLFAFCINVARIISIVMLKLLVGSDYYLIMHDSVGYVAITLLLLIIWIQKKRFLQNAAD